MYITVDGGTTNTRICLFDNGVKSSVKINIGARLGLNNKTLLFDSIKEAIKNLLSSNGLTENDIKCILLAGMITSEGGLYNLPHIMAPAGVNELKNGIKQVDIPEISSIKFNFIPGVRKTGENPWDTDVMRGEEAELFGISALMDIKGKCAYVLPGSHSKLVFTDEENRITDFFTTLTGEMIFSLKTGTILDCSVDLKGAKINDMLFKGYEYTLENGINKALFKVRVLDKFSDATKDDAYSFFIGVLLFGEVEAIKKSYAQTILIAGKNEIKEPQALLLKKYTDKNVVIVPEEMANNATSYGMVRIFENADM